VEQATRDEVLLSAPPFSRGAETDGAAALTGRPVWLVLAEPLPTRIFLDCGIAAALSKHFGERLKPVFLVYLRQEFDRWVDELGRDNVMFGEDLMPTSGPRPERFRRRVDAALDWRLGYFPLAIRFNYRHGFHVERMRPGHPNSLLDSGRIGPLPRWRMFERLMQRWYFSGFRHVPATLVQRLRADRPAIVLSNVQMEKVAPFFVAARRLRLPLVGYVASWDHPVGKGVISPHFDRYLVQNEVMREDLARYHNIDPRRVVVTGWPQSDVFSAKRPRAAFDGVVSGYGLDPGAPVVLVMGNTPANAPYEGRFVERLVAWRTSTPGAPQLLFRPHPVDRHEWRERFAAALDVEGVAVQAPSYTDFDVLATLLGHADCVVANAGTILLDALVNDRPAVCVLYDEGAPPGESWAAKNVIGEHYRELIRSGAFLRAESFDEVVTGIERSLEAPAELAGARREIVESVVGRIDGRAVERIVQGVAEIVDPAPSEPSGAEAAP
jgi:CDP-Glycerol:Poly(glycerophosphate) glycerophosphotransferase